MDNLTVSIRKNDSLKAQLVALYLTFKQISEGMGGSFTILSGNSALFAERIVSNIK